MAASAVAFALLVAPAIGHAQTDNMQNRGDAWDTRPGDSAATPRE